MHTYRVLFEDRFISMTVSLIGLFIFIVLMFAFYLIYRKFNRKRGDAGTHELGGFDVEKLLELQDSIWLSAEEKKEIKKKMADEYLHGPQTNVKRSSSFSVDAFLARAEIEAQKLAGEKQREAGKPVARQTAFAGRAREKAVDAAELPDKTAQEIAPVAKEPALRLDPSKLDPSLLEALYLKGAIDHEEYERLKRIVDSG